MPKPKQYVIRNIGDIFQIPEDRFDSFLAELKDFYGITKATLDLTEAVARTIGEKRPASSGIKMIWIDDNKSNRTITFVAGGK